MDDNFLDDHVLAAFAESFYGYGSYAAPWWFVGMEEGGGDNLREVTRRLQSWERRGRHEVEDLRDFHLAIGAPQFFGERPRLQATWNKLVRVVLSAEGKAVEREAVRRYQKEQLGRHGGSTGLIELLPLPSPSIGHWHYNRWSRLPHLVQREGYRAHYGPSRAAHIRHRIEAHQPRAVLFYGLGYRAWWESIAAVPFVQEEAAGPLVGRTPATLFLITRHPAARGIPTGYFERVGQTMGASRSGNG